jgi:hypothetical protein
MQLRLPGRCLSLRRTGFPADSNLLKNTVARPTISIEQLANPKELQGW